MTWNHRVVRSPIGNKNFYGIHEVYYTDDGIPFGLTEESVGVSGDSVEHIRETLRLMIAALSKPILDIDDIVVTRFKLEDLEKKCPRCATPWFVAGKGSQIDAYALRLGTESEVSPGFDGMTSRYRCRHCMYQYDVVFPDGSVPIG